MGSSQGTALHKAQSSWAAAIRGQRQGGGRGPSHLEPHRSPDVTLQEHRFLFCHPDESQFSDSRTRLFDGIITQLSNSSIVKYYQMHLVLSKFI